MKSKEDILLVCKNDYKPSFLLGWMRFLTYNELVHVDMLEPYDAAIAAKQIKNCKEWDKLVVPYNKQNLVSALCILMRKLFSAIVEENWLMASIYANDVQSWLTILDDTEYTIDASLNSKNIINYYKNVGKKYKIDF